MADPLVLITGATGFIGGAVTARLLETRPDVRLLILARDRAGLDARARVERSGARHGGPPLAPDDPRVQVLEGDLTVARALEHRSLDQVTHVLHLAASTSFRSVKGVRSMNLIGALALANRMRHVRTLARFLHVSTAFVVGAAPPAVVEEADAPNADADHIVEYTRSKAEFEFSLLDIAQDLPWIVARPSVVIGHSRLGCRPSASIFWYYRALDLLRRSVVPLDTRRDVVPVDWVADALIHLLFRSTLAHRCYHVSAGHAGAVTFRSIAAAFDEVHGARPDDPWQTLDFERLVADQGRLARLGPATPAETDRLLSALALYARFTRCGAQVFDNRRLLAEGMQPPPPFVTYLARCARDPGGRSVHEQMRDDD